MSTSPLAFDPFVISNLPGPSFLDVGCGYGKWGYLLRTYKTPDYGTEFRVTGIDIFQPHVDRCNASGIYDDVQCASALELPFEDESFDSVVCCEVLEHLTQAEGPRLISELRRVSRKGFIVSTPLFQCLRGGGETLDGFNEYEAHQYCYGFDEFKRLGFTQVHGIGLQSPSWKLSVALSSLTYFFPKRAKYGLGYWWRDGCKRIIGVE